MKPYEGGIIFESSAEIDVLGAGLRALRITAAANGIAGAKASIDKLISFVGISNITTASLCNPDSPYSAVDGSIELGLTTPVNVKLADLAVHTVAEIDSVELELNDPLRRQVAIGMLEEYQAALGQ